MVVEQRLRVEQHAAVPAAVRGRARAVHEHVVTAPAVAGIEPVPRVIDLLDHEIPALQLRDQPSRPLRMLVEYPDYHKHLS